LKSFISTASGVQATSQYYLTPAPDDANAVLNGSYMVLACISGYTNTGGCLNVTCLANGSWTQFPNCVSNTGSGSMTTPTISNGGGGPMMTTAISTGNGSPCMIDPATTFNISNGYYSSSSLSYASVNTATGNYIKFSALNFII